MNPPWPAASEDQALRRLAGGCFLALKHGNGDLLPATCDAALLARSGLAGLYGNLCRRFGVRCSREAVVAGMQLSARNGVFWQALQELLAGLAAAGIEPVLFKGGAVHARWPALRDLRALADYDLIVPQAEVGRVRALLEQQGFTAPDPGSRLTRRLSKGWMECKGEGLRHQNYDIHARVTEPPVCASLTRSLLASSERAEGIRIPDIPDCVAMIALHVVRSGMYRPLQEYIDLLWYTEELDEAAWALVTARANRHQLMPALFLSLRQAIHCLALDELAPERARRLGERLKALEAGIGPIRRRGLDWLAPANYPLHPVASRNHPLFRRSLILGFGTSSSWRVAAAFIGYGAARAFDWASGGRLNPPAD